MGRERIRYSIRKAVAWAAAIRVALDKERPLPFEVRIPGFEGDHRSAAFAHWAEYVFRALHTEDEAEHWIEQFHLYRTLDTLEDEFSCLLSVLRCVQREQDGTAGTLTPDHLLPAAIFGYSFANYRDHLGIGNIRYEDLMPIDANLLRLAVGENWPLARVAKELDVDTDNAASLMQRTKEAIAVVDASTPAESFRVSIRQLVKKASEKGLNTDQDVERLVTQICYRVSDLSCLLEEHNRAFSDYCQALREDPDDIGDEMQDI